MTVSRHAMYTLFHHTRFTFRSSGSESLLDVNLAFV